MDIFGFGLGLGVSSLALATSLALTPRLNLDFTSGVLDSRITASGGANGTRVNSSGLIVAATCPRFDYNPVSLAAKGVLIEEARTNKKAYSEALDNAGVHPATSCTVTANAAVSPDGNTTADKFTENSGGAATHYLNSGIGTVANDHVISIYAKYISGGRYLSLGVDSGSQYAWFDLQNGTVLSAQADISASIVNSGNGWYRCIISSCTLNAAIIIASASTNGSISYAGDGRDCFYIWGLQVEEGAFATSYIPTAGSTVTRTADSLRMTGTNFSSWYNQTEGTFIIEAEVFATGSTCRLFSADDGGANERILAAAHSDTHLQVIDGGVAQVPALDAGGWSANTYQKAAAAYKINDFAACINGGAVAADAVGTVPTVNKLHIFAEYTDLTTTSGHIKSLKYYNTRLTDAQLQQLTL